ncbi:hypothetical protein ACMZOO_12795 [Catenovulum sp. SX2]|uniref:hypothetical protein n=1 Tax=Catenovulum sp. SX2 TaxID=3398614 RepID=UPI003F86BC9F
MKILTIVIIVFLSGCVSLHQSNCSGVYQLAANWYQKQMDAANIYPLCKTDSSEIEQYRFTWLRTFHNPIFITLSKQGDNISLSGIRLDGKGGYEPGNAVETKSINLSPIEFAEFKSLLNQLDFWNLLNEKELQDKMAKDNGEILISFDGARWILEGADLNRSHSVDRQSYLNNSYKKVALFLLHKSQLDLNGDIY